jgi:hypothetical protein
MRARVYPGTPVAQVPPHAEATLDWLIWFLLPRGFDTMWREERINGTSTHNGWAEARAFGWFTGAVCAIVGAITGVIFGGDHQLAAGAIGFVVALLVRTILPGFSTVREVRARRGRGRDCR